MLGGTEFLPGWVFRSALIMSGGPWVAVWLYVTSNPIRLRDSDMSQFCKAMMSFYFSVPSPAWGCKVGGRKGRVFATDKMKVD